MDDATRTSIIIAAAQAAGPDTGDGNWGTKVEEKAASAWLLRTAVKEAAKPETSTFLTSAQLRPPKAR